ncbi:polysaccharide deacetylase family protein [Kitasatospora sp. NPDC094016]|uniref:polysaccharide deacetylase family protein n=1 Tax=Kitasatospora sp. NPDC094016 TaxID=3154986 RepID=UPI003329AC6C
MLSDHQISPRTPSRRLLLVAAGMSLLGAAGCGTPWNDADDAGAGAVARPPGAAPEASGPGSGPEAAQAAAPSEAPPQAATAPPAPAAAPPPMPARRRLTEEEAKPVNQLDPNQRVVGLTIDDGPDPRYTPAVLALLQQYGIRATFFLVGECAVENTGLVREIADHGHHIGNHTWTHPDLRHMSDEAVRDELERTSDLLYRTTGRQPSWFRAPGGDWSPVALRVTTELGMRPMGWTVDPEDWATPGTSVITERILKNVRPGSIVLNHDGGGDRSQTVAALKAYLPVLVDQGYSFSAPSN